MRQDLWSEEENEVYQAILRVFELGKNRAMELFNEAHSSQYTRFSDLPPHGLQRGDLALRLKGSIFTELVDLQYQLRDVEIRVYGDTALATYILEYSGVVINSYTFEGRKLNVSARCTTLLKREGGRWIIEHEHFSRLENPTF